MTSNDTEVHDTGRRVALITGGSRGLGFALAQRLAGDGWHVVVDARDGQALADAVRRLPAPDRVTAVAGDVTDPAHRQQLALAVAELGRLDLLVNNASALGPTPLPALADAAASTAELERVLATNVVAPLALTQAVLPLLRRSRGSVVNVSSDAAVQAYPGWGVYGASKAALDQLSAVLAAEEADVHVYAVDPGDLATEMHRAAVPEQDLGELPTPESVVPHLLPLLAGDLPAGRYAAADLAGSPA